MLDVDYDAEQRSFAAAIGTLCERVRPEWTAADAFPELTWRKLAEIGLFEFARTSDTAVELAAVMEELGRVGCPGPLWETVLGARCLEPDEAVSIVDGTAIVSVCTAAAVSERSDIVVELAPDGAWRCRPELDRAHPRKLGLVGGSVVTVRPARVAPIRADRARAATLLADTMLAAYLVGAAGRIIHDAARYVAARNQFGRPLGDLQGVAFPLAECDVGVSAARAVTRRSAARLAETGDTNTTPGSAALIAAVRAARLTVATGFQVYGAMAFTEECSVAGLARRITQLSVQALPGWRRRAAAAEVLGRHPAPSEQESTHGA